MSKNKTKIGGGIFIILEISTKMDNIYKTSKQLKLYCFYNALITDGLKALIFMDTEGLRLILTGLESYI